MMLASSHKTFMIHVGQAPCKTMTSSPVCSIKPKDGAKSIKKTNQPDLLVPDAVRAALPFQLLINVVLHGAMY